MAAKAAGTRVIAVVPPGTPDVDGTETLHVPLSDTARIVQAIATLAPVVSDVLIAPSDDPLAAGATGDDASQLLAAFMTTQVMLATAMLPLVSMNGSVGLSGSIRCQKGQPLEAWFERGLAQVAAATSPRRCYLVIPGQNAGVTWFETVTRKTGTSMVYPDPRLVPTTRTASTTPTQNTVAGNALTNTDPLSDDALEAALAEIESGSPRFDEWTESATAAPGIAPTPPSMPPTTANPAVKPSVDPAVEGLETLIAHARTELETVRRQLQEAREQEHSALEAAHRATERAAQASASLLADRQELADLEKHLAELRAEHADALAQSSTASRERDHLTESVEKLRVDAAALTAAVEMALSSAREGLPVDASVVDAIAERVAKRQARATVAGHELEAAETLVRELKAELHTTSAALETTKRDLTRSTQARIDSEERAAAIEMALNDLSAREAAAREKAINAEQTLAELDRRRAEALNQLGRSQEQMAVLEGALAGARDALEETERRHATAIADADMAEQRAAEVRTVLAKLAAEQQSLQSDVDRVASSRAEIIAEIDAARARAELARNRADEARQAAEATATVAGDEVARLEAEALAAEQRLTHTNRQLEDARMELARSRQQHAGVLAETARVETEATRTAERVTELRAEQTAVAAQTGAARSTLDSIVAERDRITAQIETLREEMSAVRARQAQAEAAHASAVSRQKDAEHDTEMAREAERQLRAELEALRADAEASSEAAEAARRVTSRLVQEAAAARSRADVAQAEMRSVETELDELREELETERAQMQKERAELDAEIARRLSQAQTDAERMAAQLRDEVLADTASARSRVDTMLAEARAEADRLRETARQHAERAVSTADATLRQTRESAQRDADQIRHKARQTAAEISETARRELERARAESQQILANAESEASGAVAATLSAAHDKARELLSSARDEAQRVRERAELEAQDLTQEARRRIRRRLAALDRLVELKHRQGEMQADTVIAAANTTAAAMIDSARAEVAAAQAEIEARRATAVDAIDEEASSRLREAAETLKAAEEEAAITLAAAHQEAEQLRIAALGGIDGLHGQAQIILNAARADADRLRADADKEAAQRLIENERVAQKLRDAAREEAEQVHREAQKAAERQLSQARDESQRILDAARQALRSSLALTNELGERELAKRLAERADALDALDIDTLLATEPAGDQDLPRNVFAPPTGAAVANPAGVTTYTDGQVATEQECADSGRETEAATATDTTDAVHEQTERAHLDVEHEIDLDLDLVWQETSDQWPQIETDTTERDGAATMPLSDHWTPPAATHTGWEDSTGADVAEEETDEPHTSSKAGAVEPEENGEAADGCTTDPASGSTPQVDLTWPSETTSVVNAEEFPNVTYPDQLNENSPWGGGWAPNGDDNDALLTGNTPNSGGAGSHHSDSIWDATVPPGAEPTVKRGWFRQRQQRQR